MKIVVTLEIDVPDTSDWTQAYGIEGALEIRQDVKQYVFTHVQGAACWDEVEGSVTLR